jgi:leucyl aminopeptidase
MEIKFVKSFETTSALVIGVNDELKFGSTLQAIDKKLNGIITNSLSLSSFKGTKGEICYSSFIDGKKLRPLVIIGIGKEIEFDHLKAMQIGGKIYTALKAVKYKTASVIIDVANATPQLIASNIAYGALLKSYSFDKYKTQAKPDEKYTLDKLEIVTSLETDAEKIFSKFKQIASGIDFTRNLVSEPPNILYPESFAKNCKTLEKLGIKVEVLGVKEMTKLGMGALLGVGQGSRKDSQLVIMQYNGGSKDDAPIAFVGKGVTFDTGGISIKPAAGMEDMKYDMAGAGAVTGVMKALAARKAKANVVGIIGLVENMPGGNAQRPSDVVTSMSGQTIEVLNTDAEGRLVLADALWYCQDRFKPKFMVNLATLTGAIVMTLGANYAGLFSNDDDLSQKLLASGLKVDEKLWRLPLSEVYDKQINSEIADMQNIGNEKGAGSITAAQFLQRFVNKTPWAHLDIAGTAWARKDYDIIPKGATGFGVRLLNQLIEDYYEV